MTLTQKLKKKNKCPFLWTQEGVKYLGINIMPQLNDLFLGKLYSTVKTTLKIDLMKWFTLPLLLL